MAGRPAAQKEDDMALTRQDFPDGFLFGAASAAYQIEGSSFGGAGPCHWDSFAATPGNVVGAEDGSIACDHYHRWAEDLDLAQAANLDAYRFSTSWARVLPEGRGRPNPEGLDFYDRLVDGILQRGMRPFQTLYHWELPAALADLGGWTNRDVAGWFGDLAELIDARIGDRVAQVATINEPWCVAWLSHFLGIHAPGKRDIRAAARAMHHVLLAHATAVQRLRAAGRRNLGIVLNFDFADPASNAPADWQAAALQDAIGNRWFAEGVFQRAYPPEALAGLAPHMPAGWQDDMALIGQPLDWLGVNYYTRHLYAADPGAAWPATRTVEGHLPKTQMGWEINPDGLYHFLMRMHRLAPHLPLYVTENGMAWDDRVENGAVQDPEREEFIDRHLAAVKLALDDGANVKGFFYWSLTDNFEWAEGYAKRFGLIHIDYETLQRRPKSSYHRLARMLGRD
jgi:beta-glucosidase